MGKKDSKDINDKIEENESGGEEKIEIKNDNEKEIKEIKEIKEDPDDDKNNDEKPTVEIKDKEKEENNQENKIEENEKENESGDNNKKSEDNILCLRDVLTYDEKLVTLDDNIKDNGNEIKLNLIQEEIKEEEKKEENKNGDEIKQSEEKENNKFIKEEDIPETKNLEMLGDLIK